MRLLQNSLSLSSIISDNALVSIDNIGFIVLLVSVPVERLPVDPSGRVVLLRTVVVDWLRDDVLTAAPRLCVVLPRVSRDVS